MATRPTRRSASDTKDGSAKEAGEPSGFKIVFSRRAIPAWLLVVVPPVTWRAFWRLVEIGGGIDFLINLGAKSAALKDVFLGWGWLPLTFLGVVWLPRAIVARKGWPLRFKRALRLLAALLATILAFQVGRAFPNVGVLLRYAQPFEQWGGHQGDNFLSFTLDLHEIARYSDDYAVQVVCRGRTPGVPFWNDKLFGSAEYTISDRVAIELPLSAQFAARLCATNGELDCGVALVSKADKQRLWFHRHAETRALPSECSSVVRPR